MDKKRKSSKKEELLSIIVPCFNEEESILLFYNEVNYVLKKIDIKHEFIFVDDGSKDNSLEVMKGLNKKDKAARFISFSRNFGKEAAMYAGFQNAKGDYVCTMDADLQHPPALLPKMLEIIRTKEYDSVATKRVTRSGEAKIRSFFSSAFYKIINKISNTEVVDGATDFRLMNRKMTDSIISMGEYNRFTKGLYGWVGFKTYWLSFDNVERTAGTTKWSFWGLVRYAINGILNFSDVPLDLTSWLGCIMTFVAFVFLILIVIDSLVNVEPIAGWASTICVIIFIGGVQLLCLGVIGQYISKIYTETKKRPQYIVSESSDKEIK